MGTDVFFFRSSMQKLPAVAGGSEMALSVSTGPLGQPGD